MTYEGTCYVLLTRNKLQRTPGFDQEDMASVGAELSATWKMGDGHERFYVVAVFSRPDGGAGRALVVAADKGLRDIVRVETLSDRPGFSALIEKPDGLIWAFCLYCGHYTVVEGEHPEPDD